MKRQKPELNRRRARAEAHADATAASRFFIENRSAEEQRGYLQRGRAFERLSLDELRVRFIEAMRMWASNWQDQARRGIVSDVQAEYAIRQLEPPLELVRTEIEAITQAARRIAETWSEDKVNELGGAVMDAYERSRSKLQ